MPKLSLLAQERFMLSCVGSFISCRANHHQPPNFSHVCRKLQQVNPGTPTVLQKAQVLIFIKVKSPRAEMTHHQGSFQLLPKVPALGKRFNHTETSKQRRCHLSVALASLKSAAFLRLCHKTNCEVIGRCQGANLN